MNDKQMSFRIANSLEIGGPDHRYIEATFCCPDGEWVIVVFDKDLAHKASDRLGSLASQL